MRRTAVLVVLLAVCSVAAPAQSKIAWINSESIMQTLPEAIDAQKTLEADLAYAMTDWEAAQGALEDAQR